MRRLAFLPIILIGFTSLSKAGLVTVAGDCGDVSTPISVIQGAGAVSPHVGATEVVVEAVVVGDFQGSNSLRGFYLQDSDADKDVDSRTSNGIFVFDGAALVDVDVGDVVRVQGKVTEFFDLTELTGVSGLAICSRGNALPNATALSLPFSAIEDFERVEGMRVIFPGSLHVTDNFNLARFGKVGLSVGGPLENPTSVVAPGAAANAMQALNDRSRIQLDDGSNVQYPLPPPPYFGVDNSLRIGDTVTDLEAVMSFGFGSYELQPVSTVNFIRNKPPGDIPEVSGSLRVVSFNLQNYFTTLDDSGSICGPSASQRCRGADNAAEFSRQREKLLATISKLDADVVGLVELENDDADTAIADLAAGLNAITGSSTFEFVATGTIGTDAIRVGFIYKPGSVTPRNRALLESSVDARYDDSKNRPALAQTFVDNDSGEVFTLLQNHLKSKGSPCDDADDPDKDDGQGNCNLTRVNAVLALRDWLATDPTASGSDKFMILGDLNAYAREDPLAALMSAGYVDLVETHVGSGFADGAHSFSFAGQAGRIDHALASPAMAPNVTDVAFWHINADESKGLDYNDINQPELYSAHEFRSSDHDPIVIGLFWRAR
ncbi:MAG: ExeM/NucH family extracellular endonuclease [Gammaproteobacteria bacterium]|nr:ExeM/NucH family extracellular endonuclease [Gammaproteobacteria bacterium]